jgi:hypothetical protein
MSKPLYKYIILQRCDGRSKWWEWPYESFFLQKVKNVARRLRAAAAVANSNCEYRVAKREVDPNGRRTSRRPEPVPGEAVSSGVRLPDAE